MVRTEYMPPSRITEISGDSFKIVKKGMLGVVHDVNGTAKSGQIPGHLIAGKTGTAQNPLAPAHKLFVAFAPYDDPKIAVACVTENTGDYPFSVSVLIVKKVLMAYFTYYSDDTVQANDKDIIQEP